MTVSYETLYEYVCPDCLAEQVWAWDFINNGDISGPLCQNEDCAKALCVCVPKDTFQNGRPKPLDAVYDYAVLEDGSVYKRQGMMYVRDDD